MIAFSLGIKPPSAQLALCSSARAGRISVLLVPEPTPVFRLPTEAWVCGAGSTRILVLVPEAR